MTKTIDRAQFLRGRFGTRRDPIRPPWALDERRFVEICERCDACRESCPEAIIVRGRDDIPEVSFAEGACTFCAACVAACPSGALARLDPSDDTFRRPPWTLTAEIAGNCLSLAGITCRVCGDQCEAAAISFQLAVGGVAVPTIDGNACTGCGACVAPCPMAAVTLR